MIDTALTRIARASASGRTLILKAKFADFKLATSSQTLAIPMSGRDLIAETGRELVQLVLPVEQNIRLFGLTLSGLGDDGPGSDHPQPLLKSDSYLNESPLPRPSAPRALVLIAAANCAAEPPTRWH